MATGRRFRLRCSYLHNGSLRDEMGHRVATIDLGGRAGSVKRWPAANSEPAFVLLLLLSVRVGLFEQATRVSLPGPTGP